MDYSFSLLAFLKKRVRTHRRNISVMRLPKGKLGTGKKK